MSTAKLAERRRRLEQVTRANGYCAAEVATAQAKLARMAVDGGRSTNNTRSDGKTAAARHEASEAAARRKAAERMARRAAWKKAARDATETAAREKAAQDAAATMKKAAAEAEDEAQRAVRQKAIFGFATQAARYGVRLIFFPIVCLVNWIDTGHLWPRSSKRQQ